MFLLYLMSFNWFHDEFLLFYTGSFILSLFNDFYALAFKQHISQKGQDKFYFEKLAQH